MDYIVVNGELYHDGVKGMKWGVRRYQNKDGTLTELGKKRYNRDVLDNNAKKKKDRIDLDKENPDVHRWVREDIGRSKKVVDESRSAVKELQNIERSIPNKKHKKLDLSSMSDQELRSEINRAMLEKQYNDMFNPQKASKGRQYCKDALEIGGAVLAIGSSALGIALAIKELKS